MDTSFINSIVWGELEHAYGSAQDSPHHLMNLIKGDEDEIDEAVFGFLHSSACHQYSTYSSTPFIVRSVVSILNLKYFEIEQTSEILGFIHACTHSAKEKIELRKEIINGSECFKKYLKHSDPKVVKNAKELITFCEINGAKEN